MKLTYRPFGTITNCHWEQIISTNDPNTGTRISYNVTNGITSYYDDSQSGVTKWYFSPIKMKQNITCNGAAISFVDAPRRQVSINKPYVTWSAQLKLIANGRTIMSINYGFTRNIYTGTTVLPYSFQTYFNK